MESPMTHSVAMIPSKWERLHCLYDLQTLHIQSKTVKHSYQSFILPFSYLKPLSHWHTVKCAWQHVLTKIGLQNYCVLLTCVCVCVCARFCLLCLNIKPHQQHGTCMINVTHRIYFIFCYILNNIQIELPLELPIIRQQNFEQLKYLLNAVKFADGIKLILWAGFRLYCLVCPSIANQTECFLRIGGWLWNCCNILF